MAKRAWLVRPDSSVVGVGPDGSDVQVPAVSLDAFIGAVVEAVVMVHRGGGCLSVIASRVSTGIPDERVSSAVMVEWKDRTDARPQPESDGPVLIVGPAQATADEAGEPLELDDGSVASAHRDE